MSAEPNAALVAALAYAERLHWCVFPCNGKVPAIPAEKGGNGCLDASTDPEQIATWWKAYPGANIGIACGQKSGIFVVDLDEKQGKSGRQALAELEEQNGYLPETPEQITPSGGRHLVFKYPNVEIRNSQSRIATGIDVRGESGYVLAAPSIHPGTGTAYTWHPDLRPSRIPIAEAPEWLVKLAHSEPVSAPTPAATRPVGRLSAYGEAALDGAVRNILGASAGSQETTLNSESYSIGRLVGGDVIPAALALKSLLWAAHQLTSYDPQHPWRARQIDRKVRAAFNDGLLQPRGMPHG
jgi:hypothetical protein